jgi:hypothetical protein
MKRVIAAILFLVAAVYLAACAVDEAGLPRNNLTGANNGEHDGGTGFQCAGSTGAIGSSSGGAVGGGGALLPSFGGTDGGNGGSVGTAETKACLAEGLKDGFAFTVTSCGKGRALCKVRDDVGNLTAVVGCNPIPGFTCVPGAC